MSRTKFFLLLLLAAALAMVIVALNAQTIAVELAFVQVTVRLGVALVFALAIGLVFGILLRGIWVAELLSERGRLRRALKVSEARALAATANDAGRQA